jgi:membrane-associated phospholipid phosphatase
MAPIEIGWGLDLILWFQSWRTPLIEAIGRAFAFAGSEDFYLLILPLIYWCIDAALGRRLAPLLMLSFWANAWLKAWWQRPRPFFVSPQVRNVVTETGYGLPSGHTQSATTLWGAIAIEARRWWVAALVILYIILMGVSRMVVGVHYPQDVLGGLLVGLVALGLYALLEPRLGPSIGRQSLWVQIGLVLVVAALALAIHPGLVPATAPRWLAEPPPLDDLLAGAATPIGVFAGLGIGFALEVRYARFSAGGLWWKRLLRFALGLLVVVGLRFGLGALFEGLEPVLAFRLIRYALIGLWAGFGAPWLFVKIRLADRAAG